ncbi:MAG: hypothetical protein IJZ04_01575 [Clostridia bacterium]|nr:hypothetical protein [Clostridia bacterium]
MIKIFANIKLWLMKRRFLRFLKNYRCFCFYPSSFISQSEFFRRWLDFAVERKNFISNFSGIGCGFSSELEDVYHFEEKELYFADKTAQL